MGYLSDPKYMKYKGFRTVDTANPYFELMYFPFTENAAKPCFKNSVHQQEIIAKGFELYYTNQCPFTAKYVPLIENMVQTRGIDFHVIHIQSKEDAQNAPTPFTTFSLFYNGEFVTHETLSEKKFEKILVEKGL